MLTFVNLFRSLTRNFAQHCAHEQYARTTLVTETYPRARPPSEARLRRHRIEVDKKVSWPRVCTRERIASFRWRRRGL